MTLLCSCGKIKTEQPFYSAITKKWICPACRAKMNNKSVQENPQHSLKSILENRHKRSS